MYERFYHLRERPFALSPDPEYLYLSRVHREALDYLRYGLESHAGFTVITGEIGAGKTTLLQALLLKLDSRSVVARVVNTTLSPRELLEAILLDFGLEAEGRSKPAMLRDLGEFLVRQRLAGRRPVLVIDEAQNLGTEALEEVRLLSNLETEKSKLLQTLLVGQPNLRDKLSTPELEQLRQRVAVSYHLMPLDAADTEAYINYRLEHASLRKPALRFPADAAALVHERSRGVPRTINVICDAALVFGYAEERHDVDRQLIVDVVQELEATGVLPRADGARAAVVTVSSAAAPPRPAAAPALVMPAPVARPERPSHAAVGLDELERDALARRDAEIAARERALAERERQIAEQRRIMAEEYRLLRRDRAAEPAARPAMAATAGRGHARAPLPATGRHYPAAAARPRGAAPRRQRLNFWQRLVRLFAGEAAI